MSERPSGVNPSDPIDDLDHSHNRLGEAPTLNPSDVEKIQYGHAVLNRMPQVLKDHGRFVGISLVATGAAIGVAWELLQYVRKKHGHESNEDALRDLEEKQKSKKNDIGHDVHSNPHYDDFKRSIAEEKKKAREDKKNNKDKDKQPPRRFHIGSDH